MPLLSIQILDGHTPQQKKALLENASQAVVESLGATLASVRVYLVEVQAQDSIVGGQIGHPQTRVDVAMIAGRTTEQKEALVAAMDKAVQASLGVSGNDIRVVIRDVPNTDLGMANGQTAFNKGR
jgi:4-oxalocrotonate tautomerase